MPPPCFDQDLGFGKTVEDFAIKQLVTQAAVERFTIAVLPRTTLRDVKRLHPDLCQPVFHSGTSPNELRFQYRVVVSGGLLRRWNRATGRIPK